MWFKKQETNYRDDFKANKKTNLVKSFNTTAFFDLNCVHDYFVQDNNEQSLVKQIEYALDLLSFEILPDNDYETIAYIFKDNSKRFNVKSLTKLAYFKYTILIIAHLVSNCRNYKLSAA